MQDDPDRPTFFEAPADLRRWFAAHHRRAKVLWIGFYKLGTGRPSVTYPEALDEALCVGWIDGVRRTRDAHSYVQRFTPRRPDSFWSDVNIRKMRALIASGRAKRPGRDAFERRDQARDRGALSGRRVTLPAALARRFRADRSAWAFFQAQAPWYRRTATLWIVSAVRDDTRDRRLGQLIADSRAGRRLAMLSATGKGAKKR